LNIGKLTFMTGSLDLDSNEIFVEAKEMVYIQYWIIQPLLKILIKLVHHFHVLINLK
jgi:hypothetical protein